MNPVASALKLFANGLPQYFCGELDGAGSALGCDFAKGAAAATVAGFVIHWMVKGAECVCAPLELEIFVDLEFLEGGEIKVCVAWSSQVIAAFIAEDIVCGHGVASSVEPFTKGVRRTLVAIAGCRGAVLDAATGVGVIAGVGVVRLPGSDAKQPAESPSAKLVLPPLSTIQEHLASTEG